jgi:hypothetical protein
MIANNICKCLNLFSNKHTESDGNEGSTEASGYSKQNTNLSSDNNIQDNYKKSYNNTTNSNNIITQMDNEKAMTLLVPNAYGWIVNLNLSCTFFFN